MDSFPLRCMIYIIIGFVIFFSFRKQLDDEDGFGIIWVFLWLPFIVVITGCSVVLCLSKGRQDEDDKK